MSAHRWPWQKCHHEPDTSLTCPYSQTRMALVYLDKRRRTGLRVTGAVFEFSTPFDEFEHRSRSKPAVGRGILPLWVQSALRAFSVVALWIATFAAGFLIVRHVLPLITGSQLAISFKSGIPLIAIGVSYFVLIITLPRTPGQRLVGILMGSAFVLWGVEQFLSDRTLISFIDDMVVFLFVVDLSIVIRQNLRTCAGERQVRKACFPVVKTVEGFNFAAQPSIDENLFRTLLQGKYRCCCCPLIPHARRVGDRTSQRVEEPGGRPQSGLRRRVRSARLRGRRRRPCRGIRKA